MESPIKLKQKLYRELIILEIAISIALLEGGTLGVSGNKNLFLQA
jgi:hypothetical protein